MTCLIVDDNPLARKMLKHLLRSYEWLTLIAECSSTEEANCILRSRQVDLIFLEIEMAGASGIDFLRSMNGQPVTIIVTACEQYALQGYELNVVDYILKPVQPERLRMAIERAHYHVLTKSHSWPKQSEDFVFIKNNGSLQRLKCNDILWMESKGDYVKIRCSEKSYLVYSTLKAMESKLIHKQFVRIHRSYLISLDKVERIEEGIVYIDQEAIPVSENYWPRLKKSINIL
jgi:two-component system, LytTR family, response regulator